MCNTKKRTLLFTLCLGFFMVILDSTIINVALPAITHRLHSSTSDLQWIVAGYTLSFASLLLLAGNLSDRLGPKRTLIIGLIGFLITSLACGLSPNILMLTIFRVLQGAAATTLIPASLSIINTSFQEKNERAKAIGIWGGMGGIAAASGPVLGSLLIATFSWRAVFLINVPIALLAIYLLYHTVESDKPIKRKTPFDYLGQLCAISFVFLLALALIESTQYGWFSPLIINALLISIGSLISFVLVEKQSSYPIIPLYFFRSKTFSISLLTGLIINCGFYGELFLLPLYFTQFRHYSVIQVGFALLPLFVLVAIGSYFSGKIVARSGPRMPILIGLIISTFGFASLAMAIHDELTYHYLILPLAAMGTGLALTMPAATYLAIHSVPKKSAGIASSAFTTARQLGSLIGVAVFGSIVTSKAGFLEGMIITLVCSTAIFIIGLIFNISLNEKDINQLR